MPRLVAAAALACALGVLAPQTPTRAQERPLPEGRAFFAVVRDNMARSGKVQDLYAYKERRTQVHTNPFGRLGTGGTLLYEVTPIAGGPGFTRRLLERDGKPVHDAEVERFGQRRNRDRAQSASSIDDVLAALDFRIDRREVVDGRPAIVVAFAPRPNARPRTREGRLAVEFSGEIWVDEQAHEVMRAHATAIDSLTYGFGIIARLGKGTLVTLERTRIEGELWMPTSIRFKGEGRAMLLRKLTIDFPIDWFDYRRVADAD
jgi:hypothetical protein